MIRDLELSFIKLHILYHAIKEEVYGAGLSDELAEHGYAVGPGTLYPTLGKMVKGGLLTCEPRTVNHKQRKYYRITSEGSAVLEEMKIRIMELYEEVIKEI
jgi:DNA-binding PadR family transcriptional regulator